MESRIPASERTSPTLNELLTQGFAEGDARSELIKLAEEYPGDGSNRSRPALWEALVAVAGNKNGQLDAARLGLWLQAHLNRVSAGHKLLVDRTNKARPRWFVGPL